ncbi:MAG: DUF4920 domain-containing protein [Myxococcales bacterium]|nr:DUF4920 domain-containing protein [Myxococcales bacterium]
MSPTKILSALSLAGLVSLAGACDKGPQTGSPTPAAKAGETATPSAKPEAAKPEAAKPTVTETNSAQKNGKKYGAGVSEMEKVAISAIVADPEAFDGKTVQVEGMVTDVCAKRGCWFEMAGTAPGEKARFKVNDGEMVFPMTAKGKSAVAQGKIIAQKLSLEDTRAMEGHYAKESGRDFDPASITEGKTVFRIEGTGAVISD